MTDIEKVARANCRGSWQLGTACGKCPRCESTRQTIDSGMDAATVQKAEWLWMQLPILTRWHAQPTYVKAIVCRAIRKIEADAQAAIAAIQPDAAPPLKSAVEVWRDAYAAFTDFYCHTTEKDAAAVIEADRQAIIAAMQPAPQWQGIESAPRDGRAILVGCWVGPRWSWWQTFSDGGPLGNDGEFGDEPTHWADAPTPPAGGSDAE